VVRSRGKDVARGETGECEGVYGQGVGRRAKEAIKDGGRTPQYVEGRGVSAVVE